MGLIPTLMLYNTMFRFHSFFEKISEVIPQLVLRKVANKFAVKSMKKYVRIIVYGQEFS